MTPRYHARALHADFRNAVSDGRSGNRTAVVIPIKDFEHILDELEELEAIRAYDEAKQSGEERIPFEQTVDEIERNGGYRP